MQASELMTADVIAVGPDTPVGEVARVLLDHGISAVPVIDSSGAPVGMVSEGDLIGRSGAERDARRDWWLALLAGGGEARRDDPAAPGRHNETAKDVMAAPVVGVSEDTEAAEIARLLAAYRIKRVPVLRDGRVVGIVSRADLLRALTSEKPAPPPRKPSGFLSAALGGIDRRFFRFGRPSAGAASAKPAEARGDDTLSAADFRSLVADFRHDQSRRSEQRRREAADRRRARVRTLIDHHVEDENWHALLHKAREAAESGQKEFLLLRFPSQLCSDRGRAINVTDPNWPTTLRGEAAELYLRWEHYLKPHGFHLSARVLEFPGGVPGDIGLFLLWGD